MNKQGCNYTSYICCFFQLHLEMAFMASISSLIIWHCWYYFTSPCLPFSGVLSHPFFLEHYGDIRKSVVLFLLFG